VRQNAVPPAPPADLDFLERFELERTCWDPKDCAIIVLVVVPVLPVMLPCMPLLDQLLSMPAKLALVTVCLVLELESVLNALTSML